MLKKISLVLCIIVVCVIYANPIEGFVMSCLVNVGGNESEELYVESTPLQLDIIEEYDTSASTPYVITEFDGRTGYYYELLTEEEQQLYGEIVTAYSNYEETVDLSVYYSEMESEAVHTVHWYVLLDYPEFFWLSGENIIKYVETDSGKELRSLNVTNNYTLDEIIYYESQLEIVLEEVVELVSVAMSEYEVALMVYEYIILNCAYDQESAEIKLTNGESTVASMESGTIVGALVNGEAVCSGYAETYTYLLNKLGINCFSVVGDTSGVGHQWNIVEIEGAYYCVDCTWGDPDMEQKDDDDVSYNYFCLTTEQMSVSHDEMDGIEYPECTASEYNYYVYNGLCYATYDYNSIKLLFDVAIGDGVDEVSFSFETEEAYETALNQLVEEDFGLILRAYSDKLEDGCGYVAVDDLFIISVYLEYKE